MGCLIPLNYSHQQNVASNSFSQNVLLRRLQKKQSILQHNDACLTTQINEQRKKVLAVARKRDYIWELHRIHIGSVAYRLVPDMLEGYFTEFCFIYRSCPPVAVLTRSCCNNLNTNSENHLVFFFRGSELKSFSKVQKVY